jgi:hypothetical protein
MDIEETIEVVNSEDGGNGIPEETQTPSEPTPETTPETEPVTPEPEVEPTVEQELYELPDGRKVDAQTLATEFKQNFLPEFTRKSQELAKLKEQPLPEPTKSPYENPDYVPQSYEEIFKVAEERALQAIEKREADKTAHVQAIESAVASQLDEVKKVDPTVNENQLFLHATKYRFQDLKVAHQNMKDMAELAKKVQQTTVQNVQKRNDPVSVSPGATGVSLNPDHFDTAADYLRALKGQ